MKIEMLSTGDEVLQGDIADTNAAWCGQVLNEMGLGFSRRQTVADQLDDIVDALKQAAQRSDWVLVNGGLGPTSDDLSAEAAASLTGKPLQLNTAWLAQLQQWYQSQNIVMPESNLKQAMLPEGAELVDNPIGTACGFIVEHAGAKLLFTPGVPSEFKKMVMQQWLPQLQALNPESNGEVKRFYTFGLSESSLSDRFDQLELPKGARLGYRSARPSIEVKLFYPSKTQQFDRLIEKIRTELAEHVFTEDQANWALHLQQMMIAAGKKLVLAESCTGGMLASELVAVAGSSAYVERGFVTYSNLAKQQSIGVAGSVIEQFGAVSIETSQAMALGALKHSDADIALSVTGIAGPSGGSDEKPVGTVCFTLAEGEHCISQQLLMSNRSRSVVRVMSTAVAMDMLRRHLTGVPVVGEYQHLKRIASRN
ncbi:CinA family nicotinamide mononucleotide deamidase-related protein [Agarivorans sp. MS3-6]|uniref:CinA family nicotinamide mononucleotide deamidase-related protein n=1 Tax=Agarivorans sp. TSD2052 TaxID=2937286 RepID=UPI00200F8C98|nr:CinA family nicotinamide mononucleotide deamidase-related protein [Agarivorans sp. TSD2052]UPW17379.1 CinA family nicotinamide mononucleotide deamidase-related protein [Agarivorans sp. TSD2052]